MKSRIVWAIAFCATVIALQSNATQGQTVVGVKLGPNISNLETSQNFNLNHWILGATVGAFARFPLSYFGIQPELLLVTKGSSVEFANGADVDLRLYYVELPVQVSFLHPMRHIDLYAMLGPAFGLEVSCHVSTDEILTNLPVDCGSELAVGGHKKWDVSGVGVVGLNFKTHSGKVLFELRYTEGLINLRERSIDDETSVSNRSVALVGGYSVPLGKKRTKETCADCR